MEQIVDIPVPGGELHDFPPDAESAALPAAISRVFFSTFPQIQKSAKVAAHSSARVPAHSSSSTRRPQDDDFFIDEGEHVWMRLDTGQWKLLGADPEVVVDQPWP